MMITILFVRSSIYYVRILTNQFFIFNILFKNRIKDISLGLFSVDIKLIILLKKDNKYLEKNI